MLDGVHIFTKPYEKCSHNVITGNDVYFIDYSFFSFNGEATCVSGESCEWPFLKKISKYVFCFKIAVLLLPDDSM